MSTPLERERADDPGTAWLWDRWMSETGHTIAVEKREQSFRKWLKAQGIQDRDHGVSARFSDAMAAAGHGEKIQPTERGRRRPMSRWHYDTDID
ncbi:hypothetical protein UFOVP464_22 [uncultured Caudovirales phage]|uniref:Uncharacterized protein n=1 Tax=uncultured Caudovirales phage TaxID=2100421 RepID=A0A6J5MG96_9CAUD|nr:hypothetical protein UFOVP464_22 [uncultured Caudovirales phage]CAB4189290.1 hypothetical protein UFOVP1189_37 [uncultured Caudovirales phage]